MPDEVKKQSEETTDFNDAFEQASLDKPADESKDNKDSDPINKDTGADDTSADEGKDDDKDDQANDDADQGGDKAGDDSKKDDKSDKDEKSDQGDDWRAKYEAEQQRTRSWEGRLRKQAEENEALKARLAELEKSKDTGKSDSKDKKDAGPDDDSEAQQILNTFYDDFPSLRKPLEVLLKKQRKDVRDELEREFTGKVDQKLQPIVKSLEEDAFEEHLAKIASGHNDWEEVTKSEKFDGWVKAQPSYLRKAYEGVLQYGSAEEIVDLLWSYKEANGLGRRSTNKDDKHDKGSNEKERRERQAADAEAVRRRGGKYPTGKQTAPDNDDFSGAFEEAAAKS